MKQGPDAIRRRNFKHGSEGVAEIGHREYVGGKWDEIGKLQFVFLVSVGLKPHHTLLDIGCGALRAGVHLIPYLDRCKYYGVDKEPSLLNAGHAEIGRGVVGAKDPRLSLLGEFDFYRGVPPTAVDFAWACSLFTHLPMKSIEQCLRRLSEIKIKPGGVFYATFAECNTPKENPTEPHDHRLFEYTRDEMQSVAERSGWSMEYIGRWGHPRGQRMLKFVMNGGE